MPLPLRDYYPIRRAAQLLKCTVDDLFHWGWGGRIRLCLALYKMPGSFFIWDWRDYYSDISKVYNLPTIEASLTKEGEFTETIKNLSLWFHEINHFESGVFGERYYQELHQVFCGYTYEDNCEIKDDKAYGDDCNFIPDLINYFLTTGHPSAPIPVELNGLFILGEGFYENNAFALALDNEKELYSSQFYSFVKPRIDGYIKFDIDDLHILKDDFIRVRDASENGGEIKLLEDEINNMSSRINVSDNRKKRLSSKAKIALKTLLLKNYKDIISNPTKIANILAAEAEEVGLGKVDFDRNTIKGWLNGD